jgi:hypothetical protein
MAKNNKLTLLKVTLIIEMIITFVYGLCYVFIPDILVKLAGAEPFDYSWVRWSGGVLVALGIGAILVYLHPEKQKILVLTFALGTLFSGLLLLYSWIFESIGNVWFTGVPTILLLIVSGLFWWSLSQAKEILGSGKPES